MSSQIVIVGKGEVGRRFASAASTLGIEHQVVTRTENVQALAAPPSVPLLLCVREDDLPAVLADIPPTPRGENLIFVQNGFIDEVTDRYPGATRAVLWFTSKGSFFADVLQSPILGPHQDLVRKLINAVGASAETLADPGVFRRYALEKAVWSCVVGAPLAVWGLDLATARHQRTAEMHAIVVEACAAVAAALGQELSPQRVLATLDDSSSLLGWMRGGTRGLGWRNGKVVEWGRRFGVPTPVNQDIVDAVTAQVAGTARVG